MHTRFRTVALFLKPFLSELHHFSCLVLKLITNITMDKTVYFISSPECGLFRRGVVSLVRAVRKVGLFATLFICVYYQINCNGNNYLEFFFILAIEKLK